MNYYEILNVPKDASNQQIKSSYKKLVKKYHPDLYVGDKNFAEQKIKEINEAYAVLSNPQKKLSYDEFLNSMLHFTNTDSSTVSNASSFVKDKIYTPPSTTQPQWSFTKWITKQINKLDSKHQLQIFVIIILVFLALFLINLIEAKDYLNYTNNSSNNPSASYTTENLPSEFETNYFDDSITNSENDNYEDDNFDALFYDLFNSYFPTNSVNLY